MKSTTRIAAILCAGVVLFSCSAGDESSKPIDLSTESAKFSYALGLEVGASLESIAEGTTLDVDILARAIKDHLSEAEPLIEASEAAEVKQSVFAGLQAKAQADRTAAAEKNAAEEEAFLETNGAREGVMTTASGLQYEVLQQGQGPKPAASDKVSVHYKGTLLDGTTFDSSYDRGEPATFGVGQVIRGWSEALQLMSVDSKYKLYIPSKLAYGPRGAGQKIGPNACLIFEVELLSIDKPAEN